MKQARHSAFNTAFGDLPRQLMMDTIKGFAAPRAFIENAGKIDDGIAAGEEFSQGCTVVHIALMDAK
jgi:hypothetical protein